MKTCTKCGMTKVLSLFYNNKTTKDGKDYRCKECREKNILEWRANNPEKVKQTAKKYGEDNKNRKNAWHREWVKRNPEKKKKWDALHYQKNADRIKEQARLWQSNNIERKREIMRIAMAKILATPQGKLNSSMRKRMALSLLGKKGGQSWQTLVPYTVDELRSHLQKQFTKNMSWENYGSYWHIDHIIPVSVFNYDKPEDIDFKKCWALNNLRPLEAKENISKGAKLSKPFQPSLMLRVVGL